MKFPETADDIKHEILISSDKYKELGDLRIRQLINLLHKVDSELVVEGVIRVFENEFSNNKYSQEQEFAGQVLEKLNPKSNRQLKEVIMRVIRNWDKSVEQFPFWLRENYGLEKLKDTFAKLQLTEIETDKLNTIKWWLKMDEACA